MKGLLKRALARLSGQEDEDSKRNTSTSGAQETDDHNGPSGDRRSSAEKAIEDVGGKKRSDRTKRSGELVSSVVGSMSDIPRQTLYQIVNAYESHTAQTGRDLLEDPDLCQAMLNDLCGKHKREIFVLVTALEEGTVASLSSQTSDLPLEARLAQLTKRLASNRALTETAARWAVESWALALGLVDVERGLTFISEGRWDDAIRELNKVVRITPGSVRAHVGLAEAYRCQGRLSDAVSEFRSALRIDPRCFEAHLGLGDISYQRKRWDEAIRQYEAAVKIDTSCARAHCGLGMAYQMQDSLRDAARELRSALKIDPDIWEAHFCLGNVYWEQGQQPEAIEEYGCVVQTEPELLAAEAEHCEKSDDFEKAIAIYEVLAETFPDDSRWKDALELTSDYSKALTALHSKDIEQARALLARVIARKPAYKKAARYLVLVVEDIDIDGLIRQFEAHLAATTLDRLGLSTRVRNLLAEIGVETAADLYRLLKEGDQTLLRIEGFGDKSLAEVKDAMPTFKNSLNAIEFSCLSPYSDYLRELHDSLPLTVTGLSGAPLHALYRAGYRTVGDVHAEMLKGGKSLLTVRGFGKKSLAQLKKGFWWRPMPRL